MKWVIGIGIVVILYLMLNARAHRIVRRHSVTLSAITGIPAYAIVNEMTSQSLTPGQWAQRHGLDPLTFEPRYPSVASTAASRALDRAIWEAIRLDPNDPLPDARTMQRVGAIQERLAGLLSSTPLLVTELEQANAAAVELFDLGVRPHGDFINEQARQIAEDLGDPRPEPLWDTQDEYDAWQLELVEGLNNRGA
jgi:hypothetical protein